MLLLNLLFYCDNAIRTHSGAESTSDAFFLILDESGRISLLVEAVICDSETVLGTNLYTKSASFTKICVKS